MMKHYTLVALFCIIGMLQINAQNSKNTLSSSVEKVRCASHVHEQDLREKHPELGTVNEFESRIAPFVAATKQEILNGTRRAVTTIPVVFHVIHNGQNEGATENVGTNYILAQLEQLNNDFRKIAGTSGDNSDSRGVDTEVEFCLAVVGPNGQVLSNPGINRINRNDANFSASPYTRSYIESTIKPATVWDSDKYLNVWLCSLSGGLLGYAQFPSNSGLDGLDVNGGLASTDGVVVLNTSVGSTDLPFPNAAPYDKGRTLTHEVGHWLGLRHIWGDENCGNDYCDDTPTQQGASTGNCPNSTTCDGNADMTKNYMDYSNDVCMNIYTLDQKARIQTVLQLSRPNLGAHAAIACNANSLIADFSASPNSGCEGTEVTFTNESVNATTYSWDFGNGNTSTAENPSAQTYSTAGTYTVTLTVGDGSTTATSTTEIEIGAGGTYNHLNGGALTILAASNYSTDATGFISGNNSFNDIAKAEYFAEGLAGATLGDVDFYFDRANTNAASIVFKVWDGSTESPGTVLATANIAPGSISTTGATTVDFGEPTLQGPFFVGFELTNATGEDIVIKTNSDGATNPSTAWEQWSNGTWYPFNDNTGSGTTWEADVALAIYATVSCGEDELTPPDAAFTSSASAVCIGESITFTDQSTESPTSWLWNFGDGNSSNAQNPTHTYASAGNYIVTLTATNGDGSDNASANALVSAAPTATISESNGVLTANVSGNVGYQWNLDGIAIAGANQSTYTPTETGDYTVTVNNENGCESTSAPYSFIVSSVINAALDNAISIYPNPINTHLSIDFGATKLSKLTYRVVNVAGQTLQTRTPVNAIETIDFSRYAAGVYIIQIQNEDGFAYRKVVKK